MKKFLRIPFLQIGSAVLLFLIATFVLYPFCKYYIDPDSTGYLTIIKRYADGQYYEAFNGLWSPLHCWISALLVYFFNVSVYLSALYVNVGAALIVMVLTYVLFCKFRTSNWERWLFCLFSAIYWAGFVYFQLVADILGLAIMLLVVLCFLSERFLSNKWLWLAVIGLGGLSVYAKNYNFYATVLILAGILFYHYKSKAISLNKCVGIFLKICIPMLLVAFPMAYFTHLKYGMWAFGLTGALNKEWRIVGTQIFRSDVHALIPPPYPNSPSYWEDPFWVQGEWHGMFSSTKYFFRYLLRLGFVFTEWMTVISSISFFYAATWATVGFMFITKARALFPKKLHMLIIVAFLYPIGLWMMHVEARYIWITLVPMMILGLFLFEISIKKYLNKGPRIAFLCLFFSTFLIQMAADIRVMINNGKGEFEMAQAVKEKGIHGAFLCNESFSNAQSKSLQTFTYFSGNSIYAYSNPIWTTKELLEDAKRYNIPYYYYFYDGMDSDFQLLNERNEPYQEVTNGEIKGLLVFRID